MSPPMIRTANIVLLTATSLMMSGCGSFFYTGQHPSVTYRTAIDHMPEDLRQDIQTVEVVALEKKPTLSVGGDYGDAVPSVGEGAAGGAAAGVGVSGAMLVEDPRSVFLMPFIFPVALVAGTITGAAAAKIQQELAEFREGMADDLMADGEQPKPNERIAEDLANYLATVKDVTLVQANADAQLTVAIGRIEVVTVDEDGIVYAHATATLQSTADDSVLYSESLSYGDRDSLRNWVANDNAQWLAFADQARQYIATEAAASMFERIRVRHVLRPMASDTSTGGWHASAKSLTPTLAWELFLLGGDPYEEMIDAQAITFDLRIYDGSRLLYEARDVPGTGHVISEALPSCRTLSWTVRPVYRFDGKTRTGDWMYYRSGFDKFWNKEGLSHVQSNPEFWQYYPTLKTRCSS